MNTAKALLKVKGNTDVTAVCFSGTEKVRVYSGFGDGLICHSDVNNSTKYEWQTLIGHTNKINHMTFEVGSLFSASQDCTVRQWNVDTETCTRIYKF